MGRADLGEGQVPPTLPLSSIIFEFFYDMKTLLKGLLEHRCFSLPTFFAGTEVERVVSDLWAKGYKVYSVTQSRCNVRRL